MRWRIDSAHDAAIRLARGILSGAFFVSYGLVALPSALLLMLPVWSPSVVRRLVRIFYRLFLFLARLTRLFRVEVDATTKSALSSVRGHVVVANHPSLLDICVLLALLPDSTAIAKSAVKRNPFLAMVVRRMMIVNDVSGEEVLAVSREHLSRGVNIVVFPQGTRGGSKLHRGAARLALASGVPISTFHLDYEPPTLAKGQPWWDVGNREILIQLHFRGEIAVAGASTHAAAAALTEQIGEKIK